MSLRTVGIALKQAAWGFLSDNAFTLVAALTFYEMLSAAPLLVPSKLAEWNPEAAQAHDKSAQGEPAAATGERHRREKRHS